ncbi:MBL fold metallo-hydrolase [Dokdonia sp. Hel_I_53]|uniref:MBL fold metallo-hydrolase n=1 Tax=Dokdonia sp. Hel_I_53 TaxID=1566287 RepID=UPI00119A8E98|nr:MBL fold metallo-hydrolase [Dokdonia sp. Hel_I_53]TVZ51003.1 L-ascorbate metabolism protein UlaG (beta-lactamase superfamily) [Dokdonia sp. Hel_I_53]
MKKITLAVIAVTTLAFTSCKEKTTKNDEIVAEKTVKEENLSTSDSKNFDITPISHASTILSWDGTTMYVDPVGGGSIYEKYNSPDVVLITDIHGDHLNVETLEGMNTNGAKFIVPQAVALKLPENLKKNIVILDNGNSADVAGFTINAIPMYNLRKEDLDKHPKGRGNGYVIEKAGKRIYFSGDTEDIPEMRNLKDIDVAFVCMNLPYTMTVENAASAVLDFAPTKVYPYHYRGKNGLSDVEKFAKLINDNNEFIEVVQLDWYPEMN